MKALALVLALASRIRPNIQANDQKEVLMSESSTAWSSSTAPAVALSTSVYNTREFWERLWRTSGLQFVGFFIITSLIYGYQPQVGASVDELVAFYDGDRTRILIAAACSGLNLLNLLWFAAALRTPCRSPWERPRRTRSPASETTRSRRH
jgi:hypothetical protein